MTFQIAQLTVPGDGRTSPPAFSDPSIFVLVLVDAYPPCFPCPLVFAPVAPLLARSFTCSAILPCSTSSSRLNGHSCRFLTRHSSSPIPSILPIQLTPEKHPSRCSHTPASLPSLLALHLYVLRSSRPLLVQATSSRRAVNVRSPGTQTLPVSGRP